MNCLCLLDGYLTSDLREMKEAAVDFYSQLHEAVGSEARLMGALQQGIPTLTEVEKAGFQLQCRSSVLQCRKWQQVMPLG